ncbi:hypothetical protein CXB51_015541 [Gossypium anomalum]|uniref:DUF7745 domain-containing protein n=1 Tax=Gossypium anomalum TaxID=47600 RepID=A0A8J5YYQ6_9ROSI|nr:hypothetical protein CXB51_015541 [Gossypium anomalum]
MRNEYLNKVEDNASVCTWSEKTQLEKEDSITEGYTSELWDFTRTCGDLSYLLDIKIDKHLFRAMVQFWNPAYSCFTFGEVNIVLTLEEYTTLLRFPRIQGNKAYVRPASLLIFVRKLVMITEMSEQWAAIGHIDEAVADLFDRIGKQNTPVLAILAETFRSLKYMSESRFDWIPLPRIWGVFGYAPLLILRQYKAGQFK